MSKYTVNMNQYNRYENILHKINQYQLFYIYLYYFIFIVILRFHKLISIKYYFVFVYCYTFIYPLYKFVCIIVYLLMFNHVTNVLINQI